MEIEKIVVNESQVITIDQSNTTIALASNDNSTVVVTGLLGPKSELRLGLADDVDFSGLIDGAVLVYSSNTSKWHATEKLNKQAIDCGEF